MKLSTEKPESTLKSELGSIQELHKRALELSASFINPDNFPKLVDITAKGKSAGRDPLICLLNQRRRTAALAKECSLIRNAVIELKSGLGIAEVVKYDNIGEIELPLIKGFAKRSGRTIKLQDWKQLKLVHDALFI
jgi:hypothetical protein